MKPELVVMLTHRDTTVRDAFELFDEVKETPVTHWGFKDVGLPPDRMRETFEAMKRAGKVTYLEVVSLTEQEGLSGARLAVECGVDVLLGTVYFDSIHDYLKDKPIKYYPFPGHVHSHPSILDGTVDEIVKHTRTMTAKGVDGFDLLTYRYTGDPVRLLKEVVKATPLPLISAGSIDSFARIIEVRESKAWGFTIGSAFFEKKFTPGGSFKDNMMAVWNWLKKNATPD
jgi:hypothetical protein